MVHKNREEKLKEANESLEYIRQVDLPESMGGGRKYVHEQRLIEKAEVKRKDDTTASSMQGKGIMTYMQKLADYGQKQLEELDLGKDWQVHCVPTQANKSIGIYGKGFQTKQGILIIVRAPSGNVFVRGIQITKDPEVDMKALNILIVQAENTADKEKGLLLDGNGGKRTPGGIYLP